MLTSVADWSTEKISVDRFKRVQGLTVSGDYRNCAPDLAEYRAWVDEGASEAERDTMKMVEAAPNAAQIAADNIASLAADAEMSTEVILRATMVSVDAARAFSDGEPLPTADLIRIASVLGVPLQSLLSPTEE